MHKLAHPDGELATSRAASSLRVPMALSSYATTSLEEVKAQGADIPYMIQMCIVKDRNITLQLLERAESEQIPCCKPCSQVHLTAQAVDVWY